nr:ORF2 [Mamastrovirus 3]
MANRQQKRQPPRTSTNIVVRNGSSSNQAGPSRAQQTRRRRNRRKPQVNIRVLASQNKNVRRNLRRPGVGSRVVFQKITTTLGTVGSNGSDQIECEMTCLLNPSTMKEATGSNTYGPVQIYASTYALFSIRSLSLSLNLWLGIVLSQELLLAHPGTQQATHLKHLGQPWGLGSILTLPQGVKGGSSLHPGISKGQKMAGIRPIHKGTQRWRLQERLKFIHLERPEAPTKMRPLKAAFSLWNLRWCGRSRITNNSRACSILWKVKTLGTRLYPLMIMGKGFSQHLQLSRMARAAANSTSKTIWVVTDTVINAVALAIPPPFSWLVRGGWWIVKRAANAPVRNGEITFDIYSSISDARSDSPCISTQTGANIPIGGLHFQQITPGNVGIGDELVTTRSIDAPLAPGQTIPEKVYVTAATMLKKGTKQVIPAVCTWYNKNGGQMHGKGVGFEFGNTKVATYNVYRVDAITDVGPINIDMFPNTIPLKLFTTQDSVVGRAVASSYHNIQEPNDIWVSNVLCYVDYSREEKFTETWDVTRPTYPATNNQVEVSTTREGRGELWLRFEAGGWYILQYAVQGLVVGDYYVGEQIVATKATQSVVEFTTPYTFTPALDHARAGSQLTCQGCVLPPLHQIVWYIEHPAPEKPVILNHPLAVMMPLSSHLHHQNWKTLRTSLKILKTQKRMTRTKNLSLVQMMTIRTHQCPGWWCILKPNRCMNSLGLIFQNGSPAWQQISLNQAMSTANSPSCTTTRLLTAYHLGPLGHMLWGSRMALALCI